MHAFAIVYMWKMFTGCATTSGPATLSSLSHLDNMLPICVCREWRVQIGTVAYCSAWAQTQ